MTKSAEIRKKLVDELRLDLIGPSHRDTALVDEILPDPPSRWYLTGFLVPLGAAPRQKAPDPQEEMDQVEEGGNGGKAPPRWRRAQREAVVDVPLQGRAPIPLADGDGLEIARQIRET